MRRVAKGVMRHVLLASNPFVVPLPASSADNSAAAAFIAEHANATNQRTMAADDPCALSALG